MIQSLLPAVCCLFWLVAEVLGVMVSIFGWNNDTLKLVWCLRIKHYCPTALFEKNILDFLLSSKGVNIIT